MTPPSPRSRDSFDAEIVTVAPAKAVVVRIRTGVAEIEAAARAAGYMACIRVADHAADISYGEFHAWLSGQRAVVRLDEHRDWHARDPVAGSWTSGEVQFCDNDESKFTEPLNGTISRVQAMAALAWWLATGEKIPELTWE